MGYVQNFSREEYLLFLLLHASHVDFEFSSQEKEYLLDTYGSTYSKVERTFQELNEAEQIVMLTEGLVKFKSDENVKSFKEALMDQFYLDGKFCKFERSFLQYITRLEAAI